MTFQTALLTFLNNPIVIQILKALKMADWNKIILVYIYVTITLIICLFLLTRRNEFYIPPPLYKYYDYYKEDKYEELQEILEKIEKERVLVDSTELETEEIERDTDFQLDKKYLDQLKNWTGKKCYSVLFNSEKDNWSPNTSVFNKRIFGKEQLLFLIEAEDGELFGFYCASKIETNIFEEWKYVSYDSFHFNLNSNGRLPEPIIFEIRPTGIHHGYSLYKVSNETLIGIGNIVLTKNIKDKAFGTCIEYGFEYSKIEKALCGKICDESKEIKEQFVVKKLIVIQMK